MSLNTSILYQRAVCNNMCPALILHLAVSAWFSLSLLPILNQKLSGWVGMSCQLFPCNDLSMGNSSNVQSSCYCYHPSQSWTFHSLGIQARSKLWILGFAKGFRKITFAVGIFHSKSGTSPHRSSDIAITSLSFKRMEFKNIWKMKPWSPLTAVPDLSNSFSMPSCSTIALNVSSKDRTILLNLQANAW